MSILWFNEKNEPQTVKILDLLEMRSKDPSKLKQKVKKEVVIILDEDFGQKVNIKEEFDSLEKQIKHRLRKRNKKRDTKKKAEETVLESDPVKVVDNNDTKINEID